MVVSILLGSSSDVERMQGVVEALKEFGVDSELKVLSAHRSPEMVSEYVKNAEERGTKVFICGAGMAAHLAGCVAALTTLPVIGIPLSGSALQGIDSLLSTVQMPKGVPVATVAIDGAYNAGILAVQILAVSDESLAQKLLEYKSKQAETIKAVNEPLR